MTSLAATITAAPSCALCVFGPTATLKYSYTVHAVQTIDITVIPHVTIFSDAPNITTYETLTQTDTIYVGGDSNETATNSATTFDRPEDITWTVGNATLTYPTTYVQYIGFVGTAASNTKCARDADATPIKLPQLTSRESFIYAYEESNSLLPTQLLDYLDKIPTVASQLDGANPADCVKLTITPAVSSTYTTLDLRDAKRYEGPRRSGTWSTTASHIGTHNSTYCPSGHQATHGTGTAPIGTCGTTPVTTAQPPYPSSTSTGEYATSATSSGLDFTPSSVSAPANDHTTAFVLNTITGRAIVVSGDNTAEPVIVDDQPSRTNAAGTDGGNEQRPTDAGDASPQETQEQSQPGSPDMGQNAGQDTQTDSSPADNIVGIIGSAAAAQESPHDQLAPTTGGTPDQDSRPAKTSPTVFNLGNTIVSIDSDGNVGFGSQVLTPGQTINVGSGASATPIVLETTGGSPRLVLDGSTYRPVEWNVPSTPTPAIITADGQEYTAIENGNSPIFAGASSTFALPAGSATTLNSVQISAIPGGSAAVVDGITRPLASAASTTPTGMVVTGDGITFTAVDKAGSVILQDGSSTVTLRGGWQTTFDGHIVSAESDGSGIIVDGSITTNFGFTATSTGVGHYINGGLGASPSSNAGESESSQTVEGSAEGSAGRISLPESMTMVVFLLAMSVVL